jgi:hypothetical protein
MMPDLPAGITACCYSDNYFCVCSKNGILRLYNSRDLKIKAICRPGKAAKVKFLNGLMVVLLEQGGFIVYLTEVRSYLKPQGLP